MVQHCFGAIVREQRTRMHISQEELSDGLCAVSTLSKIESGKADPHRSLALALLDKLDLPQSILYVPVTESEAKRAIIEVEIRNRHRNRDFDTAELLEEYKNVSSEMTVIEQQFYNFFSLDSINSSLSLEEKEKFLIETLRLTVCDFSLDMDFTNKYLSSSELDFVLKIITILHFEKKISESISLAERLKEYIENKKIKTDINIMIYLTNMNNLAIYYGIAEDFEKSCKYCDEGLKVCNKYNQYRWVPNLLYVKGFDLLKMNKDEGKKIVRDSFIMNKIYNQSFYFNENKEDFIEYFGREMWNEIEREI